MIEIFKKVENILSKAKIDEFKAEAKLIILSVSNLSYEEILIGKKIENIDEIIKIANLRAQTKKPIQQILGFCYFMSHKFYIDENVLIPRDETEILVQKAIDILKDKDGKINILDIGTGSGIIPVSILNNVKNKDIEILAIDISTGALSIALKNIISSGFEKKVVIRKSDIFSKIRPIEKFDMIISNPPYIPIKLKDGLDDVVKNFEPAVALFSYDEFGIDFYRKIIKDAPGYLKEDGHVIFELGINQADLVKDLFLKDFKNIDIKKDLAGIDRVISAKI